MFQVSVNEKSHKNIKCRNNYSLLKRFRKLISKLKMPTHLRKIQSYLLYKQFRRQTLLMSFSKLHSIQYENDCLQKQTNQTPIPLQQPTSFHSPTNPPLTPPRHHFDPLFRRKPTKYKTLGSRL